MSEIKMASRRRVEGKEGRKAVSFRPLPGITRGRGERGLESFYHRRCIPKEKKGAARPSSTRGKEKKEHPPLPEGGVTLPWRKENASF